MRIDHARVSVAVVSRRGELGIPWLVGLRISRVVLLDDLFMAGRSLVGVVSGCWLLSYRVICGSRRCRRLVGHLSYGVVLHRPLWVAMDGVSRDLSHLRLRVLDWADFPLSDDNGCHRCIVNSFIRHDPCERVLFSSNQLSVTELVGAGPSEEIEELLERDTVVTIGVHTSDDGVQASLTEVLVMLQNELMKFISGDLAFDSRTIYCLVAAVNGPVPCVGQCLTVLVEHPVVDELLFVHLC